MVCLRGESPTHHIKQMKRFITSGPVLITIYFGLIFGGQQALKAFNAPRLVSAWVPPLVMGAAWMATVDRLSDKQIEAAKADFTKALDERNEVLIEHLEKPYLKGPFQN